MSDEGSQDPGYYEALGRAIKVLRVTRGLERKDLADRAGISYPYLSQIESGAKRASSEVIRAIADALDVRPHELLESADVLTSQSRSGPTPSPIMSSPPEFDRIAPDAAPAVGLPMMAAMAAPPPQPARRAARWFHAESTPPSTPSSPQGSTRRQLLGELVALTETLDDSDLERLVDLARRLAQM